MLLFAFLFVLLYYPSNPLRPQGGRINCGSSHTWLGVPTKEGNVIKRISMIAMAIIGLCMICSPNASADGPPIIGSRINLTVTATTNGVPTNRPTIVLFNRDNVVSNDWGDVDATPWSKSFYVRRNPYGFLYLDARPYNPNPVWGIVTYTCSIAVNGTVVSKRTAVGSVHCSL